MAPPPLDVRPYLQPLFATGDGAPSEADKLRVLQAARAQSAEFAALFDHGLVHELHARCQAMVEAREHLGELQQILENLMAPPWHSATFLGLVPTAEGPRAEVAQGRSRSLVGFADDVDPTSLAKGEEVFLSDKKNCILARSPAGVYPYGELVEYRRWLPDGRLVVRRRDEEVVIAVAAALAGMEFRSGDLVRWSEEAPMAFERIEPEAGQQYLVGEIPNLGKDMVGGQDGNLQQLLDRLTAFLVYPEQAEIYGVASGRHTILMIGPPGCGKTLMARIAASELQRRTGQVCRFFVVKPAEWEDPFVGVTQANIRRCFQALKDAAKTGFAVLFMDEIDAVGRTRGSLVGHHSDKFLAALLAELDGFNERKNVAIMSATNRKDLIDQALLQRISDVEILVARPNLRGARAIFGIHLPSSVLYQSDGRGPEATRQDIIETAVSLLYSPNAGNELSTIRFRDGRTRTVVAHDLASGRMFEQICRDARMAAFLRHIGGGEQGVCVADIEAAVTDALRKLATTLTSENARHYLPDLPQDKDVVSVEPIVHKVAQPRRYLSLQVA
jgi:proteasome-associated ATPase